MNVNFSILFRYHAGRKELARRALTSLKEQTFKHWVLYVSFETYEDLEDLKELQREIGISISLSTKLQPNQNHECFYNLYLNELKMHSGNKWNLIYDSDSYFYLPSSLDSLSKVLNDENSIYICQFVRKGRVKPNDRQIDTQTIKSGSVDSASIVFHSKHKDVAMFDGTDNADFKFIKEMTEKLPTLYYKIRVVESDRRSRGAS